MRQEGDGEHFPGRASMMEAPTEGKNRMCGELGGGERVCRSGLPELRGP